VARTRKTADEALLRALACGATVENAARTGRERHCPIGEAAKSLINLRCWCVKARKTVFLK